MKTYKRDIGFRAIAKREGHSTVAVKVGFDRRCDDIIGDTNLISKHRQMGVRRIVSHSSRDQARGVLQRPSVWKVDDLLEERIQCQGTQHDHGS